MTDNPQFSLSQEPEATPPQPVSPDLVKWLREAARDARYAEGPVNSETGPTEDFPLETAGFDACEFQLANGNNVKVVFAKFWERIRYQDWREGARPAQYYAIKVYSTEDTLPRCMAIQCEFRGGKDFALPAVPKLWEWLGDLLDNRGYVKYDDVGEFIEELAANMAELSDAGEDAVEHIEHFPEMTAPAEFDKVDDSVFNDQNDSEHG